MSLYMVSLEGTLFKLFIVKFWVNILLIGENKYTRKVYNLLKLIWKYIQINQIGGAYITEIFIMYFGYV